MCMSSERDNSTDQKVGPESRIQMNVWATKTDLSHLYGGVLCRLYVSSVLFEVSR